MILSKVSGDRVVMLVL
jgi:hypothetical protein